MYLTSLPWVTKSSVRCSLLNVPNLLDISIRHYPLFADGDSRPRNTAARMQRLSANYMEKMRKKCETRLKKRLQPKGVRLSKGVPSSLLLEIDEGLKSIFRHRQRVLDKIFMENITEILSTNPIGDFIKEMGVIITQVISFFQFFQEQ